MTIFVTNIIYNTETFKESNFEFKYKFGIYKEEYLTDLFYFGVYRFIYNEALVNFMTLNSKKKRNIRISGGLSFYNYGVTQRVFWGLPN